MSREVKQAPCLLCLTDIVDAQSVRLVESITCSLFARSLPSSKKSTPVFSINSSLFCQNTWGVGGRRLRVGSLATPKGGPLTTFRINTCKSVSKQRTLTPFRMNTCEKGGEGG